MKSFVITLALLNIFNIAVFVNGCKKKCAAVSCLPQNEIVESCMNDGKAYVFPDMKCDCCGHCAPVKDVIDPKALSNCDPTFCQTVRCAPQDIKECTRNQIYAPYDGKCFCCPGCANKKRRN